MTTTSLRTPKHMPLQDKGLVVDSDAHRLSHRVSHRLLGLIERHYVPNLRLPPIRQIAEELGISVGTANQAVKDLVSEGVLLARPRLGTVLAPGCTLEHVQQRLAHASGEQKVTGTIRVMLNKRAETMVQNMAESFARHASSLGARVNFVDYPEKFQSRGFDDDGSDATAMFQPSAGRRQTINWPHRQPLLVAATGLMAVDAADGYDQISVDDEHGAFLAGRHLREVGHTSVCIVGRRDKFADDGRFDELTVRRLTAFERGWGEPVPAPYRLMRGSFDMNQGALAVKDYMALSSRPKAVFCLSDDLAIGFHFGVLGHGLRAGKDLSLIGFDGQQFALDMAGGPLTTIEVPREEIGRQAAELLMDRMKNPQQPVRRNLVGCSLRNGRTVISSS